MRPTPGGGSLSGLKHFNGDVCQGNCTWGEKPPGLNSPLPQFITLEVDWPSPLIAAGGATQLTLDHSGNLYFAPGVYAGLPGANLAFGYLDPNATPEQLQSFIEQESAGVAVISPYWVGGGATRSNGQTAGQIIVGVPGVSGSVTYAKTVTKTGIVWW